MITVIHYTCIAISKKTPIIRAHLVTMCEFQDKAPTLAACPVITRNNFSASVSHSYKTPGLSILSNLYHKHTT